MALESLQITDEEKRKLASLAMLIKEHEKLHFRINSDIGQIIEMLKHAIAPKRHPRVTQAVRQLSQSLSKDLKICLKVLGVDVERLTLTGKGFYVNQK